MKRPVYKRGRYVVDVLSRTPPLEIEGAMLRALGAYLTESNISVNCVSAKTGLKGGRKIPCHRPVFILRTPERETIEGLEV